MFMKKNHLIAVFVIIIVVAGASFWAGKASASSKAASIPGARTGTTGNFAARGARPGGMNAVFGTIIAKDATSITVKLGGPNATSTNGSATGTRIVLLSNSTEIGKFVTGSTSDLTAGESVSVSGSANGDGSLTADSIQIRPANALPRQ